MNILDVKKTINKYAPIYTPILIAGVYFCTMYFFYPFKSKFQYDPDEGLNLIRGMLVYLRYPLYTSVSSDQPPLFTHMLVWLFNFTGFETIPARVLVLCFAALLIWSCTKMVQLSWGNLAALLFLPIIMMADYFVRLSVSIMIGLPAIAMACLSVLLIMFWHNDKKTYWLVLSGFSLALSIMIKLFTGFLIPIVLSGIFLTSLRKYREKGFNWTIFRSVCIWGVSFGTLTLFLLTILVGPHNFLQLIRPHLSANSIKDFQDYGLSINYQLTPLILYLSMGLPGIYFLFKKRLSLFVYIPVWIGTAYLLLNIQKPVFFHHHLLIVIPAAMLSAGGISEGIHTLRKNSSWHQFIQIPSLISLLSIVLFIITSSYYFPKSDASFNGIGGFFDKNQTKNEQIIQGMEKYKDKTNWIVTDLPIYAFNIERPVPPILATFSFKRMITGNLTQTTILDSMKKYDPEQVLIGRFKLPLVEKFLLNRYTLITTENGLRLFIRNNLLTNN